MSRTLPQRLIALVCLVAFGLGQLVFASTVRCRDASGQSRIEFGCVKSPSGACLTTCDDGGALDHGPESLTSSDVPAGPTLPCQDEPLAESVPVVKSPGSTPSVAIVATVVLAVLTFGIDWDNAEPVRPFGGATDRDRPPDEIAHLRTVILLV